MRDSQVEAIRDEEQEYLDNMPEGMRDGDKGQVASDAVDSLSSAEAGLDDALSALEQATGE